MRRVLGFGTPILDLTISGDTRIMFENAGGMWQFGTRDWSGPTNTWLEDAPGFNGFWAFHSSEEGFLVTGSVVSEPVPEPATLWLLSTGIVGLAAIRTRKSRNSKNEGRIIMA